MREPLTRARPSFAVLLVVVFLHAALGVLVTCHVVDSTPHADGFERVASTEPLPGSATCPGCASDDPQANPQRLTDTAEQPGGPKIDPCSPDRPCQHGATHGYGVRDSATRASEPEAQTGPALLPLFAVAPPAGPVSVPACPSGPVPSPAVREPVAVLCVDRN